MIDLFRNKLERVWTKNEIILIAVVIVPLMIAVSIFFSGRTTTKEVIAYISENTHSIPKSSYFQFEMVEESPKVSQLVEGNYVAIVKESVHGDYEIMTLKNNEEKEAIQTLFSTGTLPDNYKGDDVKRKLRGIGTNIFGFITMIILMQGVALTTLYPEDRNLKTFKRIMTSPVSVKQYLFVQLIFTFLCLYIPSYVAIIVTKLFFDINIGFGLGTVAILLTVLTVFATVFGLFMSSIFDRNIHLITSGVTIITSVLSGCFIPTNGNNKVFNWICDLIPQKYFMTIVHGIEFGESLWHFKEHLLCLTAWTIALYLCGSYVTKRRMQNGAC